MTLLGRHDVLDIELAQRMRQAVGFRNVLVHKYVVVDDDIVIARLGDLRDLDDYVHAIETYLS